MQTPTGKAEIVVLRKGIVAFAVSFGVFINDLHVGELRVNDFVAHQVEPGWVKMFVGAEARSPARFPVEAGRVYYFRAVPRMGWWFACVQLEVIGDPSEGRALRAECDDKTFEEPKPFPFQLDLPGEPAPEARPL